MYKYEEEGTGGIKSDQEGSGTISHGSNFFADEEGTGGISTGSDGSCG